MTESEWWMREPAPDPVAEAVEYARPFAQSEQQPPRPPPTNGNRPAGGQPMHTVTLEDFAAVDEPGAAALLGDADQALIAEGSEVQFYGDGGAGKTTLVLDLAVNWATGRDWLGITVQRPVSSLIIENEGPRPLLRGKIRRKLAGTGAAPASRVRIVDEPWASFTFAREDHRRQLADLIRTDRIDVVIVGPLVCAGMDAAGTLSEVRGFLQHLADVRRLAGRRVCFVMVHHQNRAGQVSGAWEGAVDTLLHVTAQGGGRTRLHVQKARWASAYHSQTFNLAWAAGDSYTVEDKPELSDDDLAEQMLTLVAENPGTGWTRVERAITGVRSTRRRDVRNGLLAAGRLVNIGKVDGVETWMDECPERKSASLFLPDDPTVRHLRPGPDADGTQIASGLGAARSASASCVPPLKDAGRRDADPGAPTLPLASA